MKGYIIDSYIKTLDELPARYSEKTPEPKPTGKQVLIDVHAGALNFFDILQLQGKYQNQPPFPWVPGVEFAGKISASSPIPKGCNFVPGKTRVFGASQGSFAERLAADWTTLIPVPDGLSYEEASSLYITYPTSYAALVLRANLQKDEWCVVHAAAGGVGLCAVQMAKALGAKVIGTTSSPSKFDIITKLGGADHVLDYSKEGWQKEVLKLTGGKGANVIYDPVGMIQPSLKCIAWNGRAVVVGFAAGSIEKIPMNLVLLKNISLVGVHWGRYSVEEAASVPKVWEALLALIREGKLRPAVYDKVYEGLQSLPEGLADLRDRKTWGKAIVRVVKDDQGLKSKL